MIEVEMSKDLKDLSPKILGPFDKRQLICVGIGLAYALPLFFLLPIDNFMTKIIISIIAMAPPLACGWCNLYGLPLEKFVMHIMRTKFKAPPVRVAASDTIYEQILWSEIRPQTIANAKNKNKKSGGKQK